MEDSIKRKRMVKTIERFKQFIQIKLSFLKRFIVPFLFIYFFLMILPQIVPQIYFLPNLFASEIITVIYKGILFITFLAYFIILSIVDKMNIDWRFLIPVLVLSVVNAIVILLSPRLSTIVSLSDNNVVTTLDVAIGWTARISGIGEGFANCINAYLFLVIIPHVFSSKKQFRQLAFLLYLFILLSIIYSLVFDFTKIRDSYIAGFSTSNIQSFFDQKNTFGKYLLLGVILSIYFTYAFNQKKLLILIPVFLIYLVICGSRTNLFLACLFLLILAGWEFVNLYRKRKKIFFTLIYIISGCLAAFIAVVFIPQIQTSLMNYAVFRYINSFFVNIGLETIYGRVTIYRHEFALLSDFTKILFGYGDHIANIFLEKTTSVELLASNQTSAFHNGLLDLLSKGGLIRVVVYIAALVYLCKQIAKIWKDNRFLCYFIWSVVICLGIHSLFEATFILESSAWGFAISLIVVLIPLSFQRLNEKEKSLEDIKKL